MGTIYKSMEKVKSDSTSLSRCLAKRNHEIWNCLQQRTWISSKNCYSLCIKLARKPAKMLLEILMSCFWYSAFFCKANTYLYKENEILWKLNFPLKCFHWNCPYISKICFSSFVVHYSIEEKSQPNGRVSFVSEKQGHKYLSVVSMICLRTVHTFTSLFPVWLHRRNCSTLSFWLPPHARSTSFFPLTQTGKMLFF